MSKPIPQGARVVAASLSNLKKLETLLCCGICLEYMSTSMMLIKCSHNFCSLCIRRYINYKQQCPTCRESAVETDLRNNRQMDDIIQLFTDTKPQLVQVLRASKQTECSQTSPSSSSTCNNVYDSLYKIQDDDDDDFDATQDDPPYPESYIFSSFSGFSTPHTGLSVSSQIEKQESEELSSKSPVKAMKPKTGVTQWLDRSAKGSTIEGTSVQPARAPCPVCTVEIPVSNMNTHIDRCLLANEKRECLRNTTKRKPLVKLVYNILPDKELRKRLTEVGLSTSGDRKTLVERHREFTLRYNSECDAADPKSAERIVKEMQTEENDKQSRTGKYTLNMTTTSINIEKGANPDQIETAQKAYVKEHKSQFSELIAAVRKRNQAGFSKTSSSQISSVTEAEPNLDTGATEAEERQGTTETSLVKPGLSSATSSECGKVSLESNSNLVKNLGSKPAEVGSVPISSLFCRSPVFSSTTSPVMPDSESLLPQADNQEEADSRDDLEATQLCLEMNSEGNWGWVGEAPSGGGICSMVDRSMPVDPNLSDCESDNSVSSASSLSLLTHRVVLNSEVSSAKTFEKNPSRPPAAAAPTAATTTTATAATTTTAAPTAATATTATAATTAADCEISCNDDVNSDSIDDDDDDDDDDFNPSKKFNLSFTCKKRESNERKCRSFRRIVISADVHAAADALSISSSSSSSLCDKPRVTQPLKPSELNPALNNTMSHGSADAGENEAKSGDSKEALPSVTEALKIAAGSDFKKLIEAERTAAVNSCHNVVSTEQDPKQRRSIGRPRKRRVADDVSSEVVTIEAGNNHDSPREDITIKSVAPDEGVGETDDQCLRRTKRVRVAKRLA